FFCQAEGGIRYFHVTGVQTCALPILAGIIGKKLGMTQIFEESGAVVPVTVVQAGPCPVVQVRTREKEGYEAVQLGFGEKKSKREIGRAAGRDRGEIQGRGGAGSTSRA